MEFNNTATSQGILQEIDFLCNTNTANYKIEHKTRNANHWHHRIVAEILDAMDEWDFQGEIAVFNLVANQQEYTFPTDILKIKRIELDYDGDGKFVVAKPMDAGSRKETVATSAEINGLWDTGSPEYDTFDDSFFTYPVADTNRTGGGKVWYMKEVLPFSAFAGSATFIAGNTAKPVFEEAYHRILPLGASLDYAIKHQMTDLIRYCKDELYGPAIRGKDRVGGLISACKAFYSTRAADKIISFKSVHFRRNYK